MQPFQLAASSQAVQEATERLRTAHAEANGYGPGQGADAGAIQIGHNEGQVLVVFDKPVGYAALSPDAAVEMAAQLVRAAKAAGFAQYAALLVGEAPQFSAEGGEG